MSDRFSLSLYGHRAKMNYVNHSNTVLKKVNKKKTWKMITTVYKRPYPCSG